MNITEWVLQVVVGSELGLDVRRRNVTPGFDGPTLCHRGYLEQGIGVDRIEPVQIIMTKELSAKPPLEGCPAIVDPTHR